MCQSQARDQFDGPDECEVHCAGPKKGQTAWPTEKVNTKSIHSGRGQTPVFPGTARPVSQDLNLTCIHHFMSIHQRVEQLIHPGFFRGIVRLFVLCLKQSERQTRQMHRAVIIFTVSSTMTRLSTSAAECRFPLRICRLRNPAVRGLSARRRLKFPQKIHNRKLTELHQGVLCVVRFDMSRMTLAGFL